MGTIKKGSFKKDIKIGQLHAILWLVVLLFSFLSNLQYDPPFPALCFGMLAVLFYASVIYGNAHWLIPQYYNQKKPIAYFLLALLLLVTTIFLHSLGSIYLFNSFSVQKNRLTTGSLIYSAFTAIWIFLFSILYRLAVNYFALSKQQREINAEKAHSELHLLKQQVHPHFLFNTLNNIYYVTQKTSPEGSELIERLSSIMRYFIEESNKERVPLKNEIDLLKSYIELESIRMQHEMAIDFLIEGNMDSVLLPPLLLLPLVENIFKHGIDKRSKHNFARISLSVTEHRLSFSTQNAYFLYIGTNTGSKTGLTNLEKRLTLYYNTDFHLDARKEGDIFITALQIPVYEN
ncbi:sensor histidine kinase [Flavitalea flava]